MIWKQVIFAVIVPFFFLGCMDDKLSNPPKKEVVKPTKEMKARRALLKKKCEKIVQEEVKKKRSYGLNVSKDEVTGMIQDCVRKLTIRSHQGDVRKMIGVLKSSRFHLDKKQAELRCHNMISQRERAQGWKFDSGQVRTIMEDCMANNGHPLKHK